MKEYEFTLKFSLQGTSLDPNDHLEKLYDSGCDDALIGTGKTGSIALDFIREADSAYDAINSALQNIKTAIPEAKLIEATPDIVGLTDVAEILGCSRQNIRQIMNRNVGSFPHPIHEGKSSIWHLFTVLKWLKEREAYQIDDGFTELAGMTMKVNAAKEAYAFGADLPKMYALVS
jgi:predicted DNA-binding transcriptional regulator AlpA